MMHLIESLLMEDCNVQHVSFCHKACLDILASIFPDQYGNGGNAMLKVEKQLQVSFEMPFRWMWPSKPFKFCDYYLSPSPIKEKFLGTPNHLESKYRP